MVNNLRTTCSASISTFRATVATAQLIVAATSSGTPGWYFQDRSILFLNAIFSQPAMKSIILGDLGVAIFKQAGGLLRHPSQHLG